MSSRNNCLTKARLNGREVTIIRSYRSKNGGFFVKLKGKKRRISVWSLTVPMNSKEMEDLFQSVFGVSYKEAKKIRAENKGNSSLHRAAKNGGDALHRQINRLRNEGLIVERVHWGR